MGAEAGKALETSLAAAIWRGGAVAGVGRGVVECVFLLLWLLVAFTRLISTAKCQTNCHEETSWVPTRTLKHMHTQRQPFNGTHTHTHGERESVCVWNITWQWGNPRRALNTNTSEVIISTLNWILSTRTDWMPMRAKWTDRRAQGTGHRTWDMGHRTYDLEHSKGPSLYSPYYLWVCVYVCVFA